MNVHAVVSLSAVIVAVVRYSHTIPDDVVGRILCSDLTTVEQPTTVMLMTTTQTYPLTPYHYPTAWAETFPDECPRVFVGEIGLSDVDQVNHVVTHNMLNDPIHFHLAFPMWRRIVRYVNDGRDHIAQDAWDDYDRIARDVEAWLSEYEGIEFDGGEPYRIV